MYENNSQSIDFNNIFSREEQIFIKYGFVLVSVLGITSNAVVCYLILRFRRLRVFVNMLILNLAISDIVACFSIYPFIFLDIDSTRIRDNAANFLCGITEGLTLFFIGASVSLLTLSLLSISRYLVINHPLKLQWRLEKKSSKYFCTLIWLTSAALLIPSSLSFNYNEEKKFCDRLWAAGVHKMTYFICTGILGFLIPITSLSFTYVTTLYTLWFKKCIPSLKDQMRQPNSMRMKKRVIILLGMLIVVYLICWTPFGIYWLLSAGLGWFEDSREEEKRGIKISRYTLFVALFQTVLNPLVYAFSNGQFRVAARNSFRGSRHNSVANQSSLNGTTLTSYNRRPTITLDCNHGDLKDTILVRNSTV